jgi:hypothetical protein
MTLWATVRGLLLLGLFFSLAGCAMLGGHGYAQGEVAGEEVAARLDSPLAQAYLQPRDAAPDLRARIRGIEAAYPGVPDAAQLAALTADTSPDFASLLYARRLLQQPLNLAAQQRSHQLAQGLSLAGLDARSAHLFATHHALVVPGWFWETRSETGADLAFPRRFLAGLGLRSTLVETDEHGTVEANAGIIAQALRKARELDRPVVLVSVSKGGPEVAYALGHELAGEDLAHVRGWLNIGGVVGGSTFAQVALADPETWFASEGLPRDTPLEPLRGLLPRPSQARLQGLQMPSGITVINYAAMTFSTTLDARSHNSYAALSPLGPNDGAALMHELLMPDSASVLEIGIDHYMRSRRVMRRVIALLLMIMECTQTPEGQRC